MTKNNQTTTEAVKKILTVNGMLDLEQVDQILQLIEQEKKAVLEEARWRAVRLAQKFEQERLAEVLLDELAHSQEEREGK